VIGSAEHKDVVAGALRPFKGTVYQTTLPTEGVEALKDALKRKE
jgi:hypothetical protein